jgi:hypothetical protein
MCATKSIICLTAQLPLRRPPSGGPGRVQRYPEMTPDPTSRVLGFLRSYPIRSTSDSVCCEESIFRPAQIPLLLPPAGAPGQVLVTRGDRTDPSPRVPLGFGRASLFSSTPGFACYYAMHARLCPAHFLGPSMQARRRGQVGVEERRMGRLSQVQTEEMEEAASWEYLRGGGGQRVDAAA